ncbi:hypothetical protein [Gillisia marina]|uniref:hypothetical protein n=1 Tax=Gillisia marina TaxID=1167637 RepID=UPI00029AB725|nr:hypothetical protein [Gillisia marina]
METERFEDKIRRQLQDREITPSAGSWDKLSAKLDTTQDKKKPFAFWMGIAASIIGGILILSLAFNNATPSDAPQIVDIPTEKVEAEKTPKEISNEILIETEKEPTQLATSEAKNRPVTPNKKSIVALEKDIQQNNREAVAIIDNESLLKRQSIITSSEITNDNILDLKLTDALTGVITQTENGQTVTDEEINKLLAEAAAKISQDRYKSDFAVGKINAQDLLQDVEFEMDNSFRDKIFEMLKEGYSKAKTAVANRNY